MAGDNKQDMSEQEIGYIRHAFLESYRTNRITGILPGISKLQNRNFKIILSKPCFSVFLKHLRINSIDTVLSINIIYIY